MKVKVVFTVLLDREFIFMPLCEVLLLLFDHLKDVTTTPESPQTPALPSRSP